VAHAAAMVSGAPDLDTPCAGIRGVLRRHPEIAAA
jgi:hypothetical protein